MFYLQTCIAFHVIYDTSLYYMLYGVRINEGVQHQHNNYKLVLNWKNSVFVASCDKSLNSIKCMTK